MRHIGRRGFLVSSALVAVASTVPVQTGCSDSDSEPSPSPVIPQVKSALHIDLSHLGHWPPEAIAKLRLHVADARYTVTPHTTETRALLRGVRGVQGETETRVTHFVENVFFSAIGAQSYMVGLPNKEGFLTPIVGGIHVPADCSRPDDEDPTAFTDLESIAVYCAFHNPQIMSLDPCTAASVVAHLRSCSSFSDLVDAVLAEGKAQTPDEAMEATGGWIVAKFMVDKAGARIPKKQLNGDKILKPDGSPAHEYYWDPAPGVGNATNVLVAEALERFHNDASLEGVKYTTRAGVGSVALPPATQLGAAHEELDFIFHDQGRERGRRALEVERKSDNQFEIKVKNPNSVGTVLGVRYVDKDGNRVGDDTVNDIIGYVPGTFYPSLAAAFGPSSAEFVVTVPPGAAKLDICSSAIGIHGGDMKDGAHDGEAGTRDEGVTELIVCVILSGLIDFYLPTMMLAVGFGGDPARELSEHVLKELVVDTAKELLIDLAKTIAIDIFNAAEGHITANVIIENLKELAGGVLAAVVKLLGTTMAAGVAAVVAAAMGAAAAASAGEAAMPIVGWVLKGIEIAQTAIQLGIQVKDVVTGDAVIRSRIEPAHPVTYVVKPNAEISAAFPQGAIKFVATLTPEGRLPVIFDGAFDPGVTVAHLACPKAIPLFGTLKADIRLLNGTNEVVGTGSITVTNATGIGVDQDVEVEVTPVAIPIRPGTRLVHRRKLMINPNARTFDQSTVVPVAGDTALSCTDNTKVCQALGITLNQKLAILGYSFQSYLPCRSGIGTQLHLLNIAGPPVVRALDCGTTGNVQVALSLTDTPSCIVAQVGNAYRVFPFEPGGVVPQVFDEKTSLGALKGTALVRARVHSGGSLVALTNVGVEVVDLRQANKLGRPADPTVFFRRGNRSGQMSGPVSVAPLSSKAGYAILEQGTRRIQAFDFSGNPLVAWGNETTIQLPGGPSETTRVLQDLDIDARGNVWVLSYLPGGPGSSFRVDVYNAVGSFVVAFSNVPALGLATDAFGVLYTENAENAVGPSKYAEPSVSVWAAENPA